MEKLDYHRIMTSCEEIDKKEFLNIVSKTDDHELHKFANILASDFDLFTKILQDKEGLNRVMRILGISEHINTILFYPLIIKFPNIMTNENGYDLVSRILDVCNIQQKNLLCHTTYRHALALARDEKGCVVLKKIMTIANHLFQDEFLSLISDQAHSLWTDGLGLSVMEHALTLSFTRKTTEDKLRLHGLMAEFDEILSTSDIPELHNLVSKLLSDSDLFVEFLKTRRGSLMVEVILGKSEEIDIMFFQLVKKRFTDVTNELYSYRILKRMVYVFMERGNFQVFRKIRRLVGVHALELIKDTCMGNIILLFLINIHNLHCTEYIACGLQCHYIELSFSRYESNIVMKLLGEEYTDLPLVSILTEIIKCDEDTLVRLAKDFYGNRVLKKTLEVAKERTRGDLFDDLVEKLKPFLDSLRGTHGENIADMIDSELETIKDRIVSQG